MDTPKVGRRVINAPARDATIGTDPCGDAGCDGFRARRGRLPQQAAAALVSLPPRMRTALLAATAAVVFAAATATTATAGGSPWAAYLAPPSACASADDVQAALHLQKRALICLVNWTRRHVGLRTLRWSKMLADAAGSKADIIANCGDFSHYPCGTRWPAQATRR